MKILNLSLLYLGSVHYSSNVLQYARSNRPSAILHCLIHMNGLCYEDMCIQGGYDMANSVEQHRQEAPPTVACMIVTVSDTRTKETDTSGQLMNQLCRNPVIT